MSEHVDSSVVSAFRKRWHDIERAALAGSVFEVRRNCFEAARIVDTEFLAIQFYGIRHARKMATLTDRQIVKRLRPVVRYLETIPRREVSQRMVFKLLSSEYVLFEYESDEVIDRSAVDLNSDDLAPWSLRRYPDFANDDWFEPVGGLRVECTRVLMKATGEAFSADELRMLTESVVHNVTSNSSEHLWVFDIGRTKQKNQLYVYVCSWFPTSHYVDPLIDEIAGWDDATCISVAESIIEIGNSDANYLPHGFFELARALRKQRKPDGTAFKARLAKLFGALTDASEIVYVENVLRPHLFGGRTYFHATYGNLDGYDGIDFLTER
jgi:hypothetical protein